MIGAILRAQLLSMRFRARSSRLLLSVITGIVFYGFWALCAFIASMMFSIPASGENMAGAISILLLVATLYWQLAPLITATFGASLDLAKLLVYPIPIEKLFLAEILLRITACPEMILVLGGAAIGLLRNPRYGPRAAPFIMGGALLFTGFNVLVSAGVRNLIERWFRRSRLKEFVIMLLVLMGIAPQFLIRMHIRGGQVIRFAPSQILWPWAAAGRFMIANRAAVAAAIAAAWLVAAYVFSRWEFERSLRDDGAIEAAPRRQSNAGGLSGRFFDLPSRLLPDPLAALVEKEMRMLSRISRVRLIYAMSCFFGAAVFLPYMNRPAPGSGRWAQNALPLLAIYGLLMIGQMTYWNSFGFDRSAVMGYFCWPVRIRDVLIAKNLTVALGLLPQIAIVWAIAAALRLPASPGKFLEALVTMVAAALYWFGVGNIASVRAPRAMHPEKMRQMASAMQALTIWTAPLLLLPIVLAYFARVIFHSELIFAGVMLIALAIGGVFYYVCLDSAAAAAYARRDAMIAELSRSDGPVSIT